MIGDYINELLLEMATKSAREHSYRPALKSLFESIDPTVRAINEPSRSAHGAPDFAFYKSSNSNLVLGYVETKDINTDLDQIEKTEQLKRYLGYANLILTNYTEFRFFRNGQKYQTIMIAQPSDAFFTPLPTNYPFLEREIKAFLEGQPETITNAIRLAEIMGGKAARIRDNVVTYLQTEDERNKELLRIYQVMQELLVHDLTVEKFADMYAQTLVYGLFVARYYDESPENFNRQEAAYLIPASNPFLRHFFDHIAGINFDPRLKYIVDELCDVFAVSAVREIVTQHYDLFGEAVDKDPVIHFYEDFLKEYDPELKKNMGAYYTPVPVVTFIINAVHEVLRKEFQLPQGVRDTTKITYEVMQQGTKAKKTLHKVQILDPAVGTATFLNETVKFIHKSFANQQGVWEGYVEQELLPRLHGFELMMAPYTIAHLKLAMTFRDTGIDHFDRRLGVYLTNTLEEGIKAQQDLFSFGFAEAISEEARAANVVKNDTPIMVVMGNPPYSVSSSNKSEWITNLIKVYKENLNEKKINLDDDYIKFLRFAEYMIEKNGNGIVAMITNNSFLDGVTHRQMRKHLLETFDDIYVLNLHGSTKKYETAPDGGKDENVFNIQQGVSINIFVRKSDKKKRLGEVYYADVYGRRKEKFEILHENNLSSIKWQQLQYSEPYYFFVPKDFSLEKEYEDTFKVDSLFLINSSGVETQKDSIVIQFTKSELDKVRRDIQDNSDDEIYLKYEIKDSRDWKLKNAREDLFDATDASIIYRPFDLRWTFFSKNSKGILAYPRYEVMKHMLHNNIALEITQKNRQISTGYVFLSKSIADRHLLDSAADSMSVFPLYLYHEDGERTPNFKMEIVKKIEDVVGSVSPEDIFDYIYAILHSPTYRDKYKEFLKIDFPRIPYPKDKETFQKLVALGGQLRWLHLMEDPELDTLSTTYPISGDNAVEKLELQGDRVFINDMQFFGEVPKEAWDFYIGGYQPAQKWLKDRKGRKLTYEDIMHYQKIIKVLMETREIMKKIDEV